MRPNITPNLRDKAPEGLKTGNIAFLAYNQDTGHCFVESSPAERISEINPIGYFVRFFNTLESALRVKAAIDQSPWLARKFLNIA